MLDTIGVTGIIEGISGHDFVTNAKLSAADQTERGVLGAVTLISLAVGAWSAVKGLPGGAFLRPGSPEPLGFGEFFKGLVGWKEFFPALWKGARGVLVELSTGLKKSVVAVKDWLTRKLGGGAKTPDPLAKREPHPAADAPIGMSGKLKLLRAGLKDPRAIEQFDRMFQRLGGNSSKMEGIVSQFPDLEQRLISDWETANPTPRGAALDQVAPLKSPAEALRAEMEAYRQANPKGDGMKERLKALDGEIDRLDGMLKGRIEATPEGVQGTTNNINGIEAEFRTAQSQAGVTRLGARFSLDGVPNKVEVDVGARAIDEFSNPVKRHGARDDLGPTPFEKPASGRANASPLCRGKSMSTVSLVRL